MDGILIKVTLFWERKLLRNIKRNICQDYGQPGLCRKFSHCRSTDLD